MLVRTRDLKGKPFHEPKIFVTPDDSVTRQDFGELSIEYFEFESIILQRSDVDTTAYEMERNEVEHV